MKGDDNTPLMKGELIKNRRRQKSIMLKRNVEGDRCRLHR